MVDYIALTLYYVTLGGILSIVTMTLNLEQGVTGVPNFGKIGFLALGAFTAGTVTVTIGMSIAGKSGWLFDPAITSAVMQIGRIDPAFDITVFVLGILLALAVGGVAGMLASYPAIRLYEDYLGITLLAIAEVIRLAQNNYPEIAGGAQGLPAVPGPFEWMEYRYGTDVYYATFALLILSMAYLCFVYFNKLLNSPYGRVLRSVRDNQIVAESFGKDIDKTKIQVMIVGSAFASMAGALQMYFVQSVSNDNYVPAITFTFYLMLLLGGSGSFKGAVVGTGIYMLLDVATSWLSPALYQYVYAGAIGYLKYLVTGVLLLLILLYRPTGFVPEERIKTIAWEVAHDRQSHSRGA